MSTPTIEGQEAIPSAGAIRDPAPAEAALRPRDADLSPGACPRRRVEGSVLEAQAEYWIETLAGAPELLELPTDHPRPAKQDFAGASLKVELDEALTATLETLSQRHGAPLYVTLLAGWAAVLSRLSGQDEVVVGTPGADRGRSGIEGVTGFFADPLPVRVDLSGAPTVAEALGRVKARVLEAQANQDIPFEQVVERVQPARSLSHSPLFQVMLAWRNAPARPLELPELSLAPADATPHGTARVDLLLSLSEDDGRIVGEVEYATALFERATVERWLGYLRRALEAMVADESQPVDRLPLLPEAERRLVVEEWNATGRSYPTDGLRVHDLFRVQAARTPETVALSWRGERLTYAQLEARSNRIANALRRRGVGPEVRVGICLPRTPELVAAMLGVLGAGGAYVPLDPTYPRERLGYMLEDAGVTLVITESSLADRLPEGAATLLLDVERDAIAAESADAPESGVVPENLSHVIFTSGSTGRPKGVMIRHASVVVLLHWLRENVTDEERASVLFSTSINFDVSVAEVFGTLAWGGKLVLVENALELATLGEDVVHVSMVPSAAAELLKSGGIPASVKTLNLGGEALPNALAQGLYGLGTVEKVGNLYGPTEDTTYSTYYVVPRGAEQVLVGTPVANTRAYVLDAHLQPVPIGAVGELYLAGDGLSRGYANRPGMTAERFVPCPLGPPGNRMYRVMDRVRRRADGELEYLGRIDFQVKVRGYRIELGEIEARLAEHPGVRAPVVVVREDAPGDRRLVAYYLGDEPVAVDALKAHLSERLPGYMVPAAYVWMDAYPLTPNGKVDRRALPAPEGDAYATREYAAPVSETERALADIWAEVLGAERVGRGDDFFELGGHSLSGVQVTSRVRAALGVEVPLAALFGQSVLADFAREVESAARSEAAAIAPVDRTAAIAPSFAQQRLWFLEQLGGMGAAYHIPMRLRLRGDLDRGALIRALDRIVARHEALRTTFPAVDGEPVQHVSPVEESGFRLVEHDLRASADAEDELRRLAADEASAPFDLARGPLVRGRLVRMAADDHVLLLTMHHIVSDGWSMGVLHRELGALYAAFARGQADPLPPLPVQYADYAAWQRRWIEGDILQAQAEYWRETLAGAPELLELPTDHPRPARQDFAGASVKVELDEALTAALNTLSQRHGATLHMTLLAGWAAVLARLSGQDEVVVGTPSANRGRSEIEGLIGFFVNTLALRVDLSGSPGVAELLGRVKARSLGAQDHQDIPFEQVVELVQPVRSLTHTPLFQAMFVWQNAPGERLDLPGLTLGSLDPSALSSQVSAKFDLSLELWEENGRIVGVVDYATALFERETVERWLGYLRRVLEGMVADERRSVERLELLPDAERRRVVEEFNEGRAEHPRDTFVHERFEAQVERTPGAAALVFEDETLSYAELNARANRLAHHLRLVGVGPDARVGICAERSLEMVVGVLGVLKAGGAYVPLDPGYPAERLAYMLADSAPAAVLVQTHLRDRVESADVPVLVLDAAAPAWASLPATDPGRGALTPDHLAYVIYTSGSTGRPKGVRVPHGSVGATLAVAGDAFGLGAGDRVPSLASFAFDIWLFETLLPLLGGGTVRLVPRERVPDVPRLVEDLAGCTALHAVPALMRRIVEEVRATPEGVLGTLRRAFVGGDAVAPDLLEEMRIAFPAAEIHVLYGPTEAAIICAAHRLGGEAAARQMVGRPLGNAALYVVEPGGTVAPVGVPGELCLGGASVARDYLGRPGLTAERFVPDPFSTEPGARLYRTGDRVRWLADGSLEFLGRTDFQVKIRGFRIELGEIEARLAEHPEVRESAVLAREDARGEKQLVAYVAGGEGASAEALRAHLGAALPAYMVPAAYVRLDALPLTPNGKVDRRALPAPEGDAFPARGYEAPSGRAEEAVAAIWAELLGAERVGRRDHFFEVGGHSLLAVRVVSRVRQALGVEASPRDVFERPVLADFARGLETAARAEATPIAPVERSGPLALSFAQQRLWFLEQMGDLGGTYHIPMRLRLRGDLDRGALVRSLDRIVARHEALRTSFPTVDGEPVQHVAPVEESAFRLVEHDLHASPDAEDELRRLTADEASAPFDLARGPLVRGRLVRMAADDHVLLLTMHHIVSDGWSAGVLHRELGVLYAAFARGEGDPLPPLPVQYADYAAWHRRWVEGPVLEAQGEYWTRTLAGAPELLELPADHPRPAKQDFAGASVSVELDETLTAALKALSQRHGTTLFMTLLAGWAAVLARLSGQDEVVIGTPSANRGRAEVEELIGFFVNMLPLRVDLSGAPTVAGLLARVRALALEAQRNQDIPFEQVVERVHPTRSLAHTPLFQVMFAWQNAPGERLELPGLALGPLDAAGSGGASWQVNARFDLSLALWEDGGRIAGAVEYATALFERETVERWLGYLRRVLDAMVADDAQAVERLELLPDAERRRVVEELNDSRAEHPRDTFVHEQLEAQVERTPGAAALVFEDETLSYAELNARANRLAHHLRALGVGPDARVGICAERSLEMVVGVLGVLKAGGAYVPLDPGYPAERLAYMLADSAPAAVLVQTHLRDRVESAGVPVVELGAPGPWDERPAGNPCRGGLEPGHLAYVIYTSGSTGRPKGVCVPHGSVGATLAVAGEAFGLGAGDRVPSLASFAFDIWLFETLLPLLGGGTVRLVPRERVPDVPRLVEDLASCTALHTVPALMRRIVEEVRATPEGVLGTLRHAFVGGDAVAPDLLEEMRIAFPAAEIHVLYGPTEAAIICAAHRLGGEAASRQMVGRPLGNASLYVVEPEGTVAPVGVAGELCLGGASVARDYLGRPGLTAERFVPDPFSTRPGARLYRTGDRVRWLADGSLEFLGRTDFQVKVRGFRIEPGEIEARLLEHPGIREAVVLVREDTPGDKRLVAYVAGDETAAAEVLRAHLSERLPEYMVPAAYIRLDALPLTPNGKVDRKPLPAPEGDAFPARGYEAPSGRAEEAVAAIWAELLGAERVGRRDHFFELGGHSLLAMRVVSRVRQALGVEASPRDVFERPVLADFARALETAARAEAAAIQRVDRTGDAPLSFAQQRLWFLEQLGGVGAAYHIPMSLRLRGDLDRGALVRALDRIVARHEALRTTFAEVEGEPVQRIAPVEASAFRLVEHDLRASPDAEDELRRLMRDEAGAPFDLERGPLIRGRLVRVAADDHVLLLTMHHIVSDGWSAGVLYRELGALYAAFARGEPDPLPPLPVQYADYAAWHRRWVEGPVLEAQAEYWTRTLAGAPELLELPTDHPRPARQDFAGALLKVELDEALTAALKALSQRHGATLYMTLLAGWAAVLARLSGQDDVVIGTPSANRGRSEIEGLIGFFVNTLPVRVDLSGAPTVAEALGRVKARALEAQANQDIPFEQVVERVQPARSLAHSPLFQVMFAWQNAPANRSELPGLSLAPADAAAHVTAKFDLLLSLSEDDGRIAGDVEYATSLFEQATVERYVGYLRRVLEQMAADDAQVVDRLELLDAAERRLVLEEWNRTQAKLPRTCVHERFEAQVARTPEAVAVVFEDRSLTYAELNERANRLARHLRGRGVGPDVRVAVCVERSPELMIAFLAVLKAGGAYVPLDPGDPEDRLRHMLGDGAPAALLVHSATAARFAGEALPVIDLDAGAREWAGESAANPAREEVGLTLGHLAYVIYTSGSTGRPKGVMVEHRALANVMGWMGEAWPLGAHDVVLQKTPVSFDASARELYPPLLAGARMVIARPGGHRDPTYLVETIRREGVTTLHFVPTMLGFLLEEPGIERCTSIARVVCGGEALPAALARRAAELLPHAELHNVYGPTEAAVDVTWLRCPAEVAGPHVSIGRPMANCRAYFLDRTGEPVPAGVAGELYLGGAQVARGYLGRAALTAERFVPDPFGGDAGARLYRTGDLGRWLPDGTIEFLGRNDFQVKVRGFRIELGEIEARLREHEGVREAVVVAREDEAGDRRLVAYWVGDAIEIDALRAHLSGGLPEHMVPAAFVRLEALPLTSNGKLDRRALPAPEGDAYARRGYEAPVGETEEALAEIWGELLGVERVGRGDHFFELGGHSLLAVRLISRVRQVLGAEVAIASLFERPVLANLARAIENAARAELPAIEPADRSEPLPLSFAQQRLWFLERMGDLGGTYHVPRRLRLRGELDRAALRRALDAIVARHEALRTTFVEVEGGPVQRIAEESRFHLLEHDVGGHPDAAAALRRLAAEEADAPFDLEHGPLIRGRLVRLAEDDHVLLVTLHHIVSDAWSAGVLTRELGTLYAAFRRGEADPLPPLPVQYADYAAWQRTWVEGEVLRQQAEYWKAALAGAPELLELPADHPRPARQDHAGGEVGIVLDEALTAGLKALGRRHGATPFMTLLAGWAAVLARLSGQDEVVVGTPSANRGRSEIEGLIGFFINTLPLRVDLSDGPGVGELLQRVKTRALEAQRNQDIPFEQVVELVQPVRSTAYTPLFQATFAWQNAPDGTPELPGLAVGPLDPAGSQESAKYDLSLVLWEDGGRIEGAVVYATALFERETVERWLGYLRRVLEGMVADDGARVDGIPLLPAAERARLLEEWSAGDAVPLAGQCIHHLFEAQAARTPEAVAVVFEGGELTCAELNARANRLAHHLIGQGVGPDARVAICVERGPEMMAGLLAILKAGGAYVPLDPDYPAERLRYMLEDSAPAAVLTQGSLERVEALFAGVGVDVPVIDLEGAAPAWASLPATNPTRAGLTPGHLAYVIYTSGSTGTPKGVMIEHRSLANHTAWQAGAFGIGPDDTVLQRTSISFDASVWELWTTLATGARLHLLPPAAAKDPAAIGRAVEEGGVTIAQFVPTLLQAVLASLPEGGSLPCRVLFCGGEPLSAALVAEARAAGAGEVVNLYGPTEATIDSTWHRCGADERAPSIGRPIANVRVYLLDGAGEPVPVGVAGELCVGGAGVARGYLDRPAATAERFVPDPFSATPGARLYRAGDLGRWRPDGTIEFLGRNDFQVKVRGFRIELGEIEARLREHEGVREAVVLAREDASGEKRLVAYHVGEDAGAEALRDHLSRRLPAHMVPAAYVRLEALPLTSSGKVDRRALPAPAGDAFAARSYEAPAGETEEAVAAIWADLLGVERVGRHDDFFQLGGNSLLATRLVFRIRQEMDVELSVSDVFEKPGLFLLAQHLLDAQLAQFDPEQIEALLALARATDAG